MKELTKEEVLNLQEGTQYVVYNPFTDSLSVEIANKKDIAHNKYCEPRLKFYVKEYES